MLQKSWVFRKEGGRGVALFSVQTLECQTENCDDNTSSPFFHSHEPHLTSTQPPEQQDHASNNIPLSIKYDSIYSKYENADYQVTSCQVDVSCLRNLRRMELCSAWSLVYQQLGPLQSKF